jgi:hypothetical protein
MGFWVFRHDGIGPWDNEVLSFSYGSNVAYMDLGCTPLDG